MLWLLAAINILEITDLSEKLQSLLHKRPRKLERWQWEKGELVTGQRDGKGMGQSSGASWMASTSLVLSLDGLSGEAHSRASESQLL